MRGLKVLFVAGFGPLVRDPAASRTLYADRLGLPLTSVGDDPTTSTPGTWTA